MLKRMVKVNFHRLAAMLNIWHEIIPKITPWELFFGIFEGFSRSKSPGKKDFLKELSVKFVLFLSKTFFFRVIFCE